MRALLAKCAWCAVPCVHGNKVIKDSTHGNVDKEKEKKPVDTEKEKKLQETDTKPPTPKHQFHDPAPFQPPAERSHTLPTLELSQDITATEDPSVNLRSVSVEEFLVATAAVDSARDPCSLDSLIGNLSIPADSLGADTTQDITSRSVSVEDEAPDPALDLSADIAERPSERDPVPASKPSATKEAAPQKKGPVARPTSAQSKPGICAKPSTKSTATPKTHAAPKSPAPKLTQTATKPTQTATKPTQPATKPTTLKAPAKPAANGRASGASSARATPSPMDRKVTASRPASKTASPANSRPGSRAHKA